MEMKSIRRLAVWPGFPSTFHFSPMTYKSKASQVGRVQAVDELTPITGYFMQCPPVLAAVKRINLMKPQKADDSLCAKAKALLQSEGHRFIHAWELCEESDNLPYIPGCLILARLEGKTNEVTEVSYIHKELWDLEPAELGAQVHKLLQDENEKRAPFGPDQLNIALWVSGFFNWKTPLHGLVCTLEGKSQAILCHSDELAGVTNEVMTVALQQLRLAHSGLVGEEGADLRTATGLTSRLAPALDYGYAELLRMKDGLGEALQERRADAKAAQEVLQRERESLIADGLSRRKAAVAAKNLQIEALNARAKDLERQLGEVKRASAAEIASLRKIIAAQPAVEGCAPAAAPEVLVAPAPVQIVEDEANSHYRDTAEHQAEVIRQMHITARHQAVQLAAAEGKSLAPEVVAAPRRLADIADWAAANADRVIVLKRALHAAKKSIYEDEALVYGALDMLATTYRDVKLNLADRMAFREACEKLGLTFGGSIAECVGDEYFFDWKNRKTFMDQHIGRGVSRDPRYCFRIYFTWDAEEAKVIVGMLPAHLPTRTT